MKTEKCINSGLLKAIKHCNKSTISIEYVTINSEGMEAADQEQKGHFLFPVLQPHMNASDSCSITQMTFESRIQDPSPTVSPPLCLPPTW